jgi:flagellar biosynthesis/type III secretory pathway chaperone
MIETLHQLVEALRAELQQYGELLALLDQEQNCVLERAADNLLQTVAAIHAQGGAVEAARARRESRRRTLASHLGLAADAPFGDILPRLPEDYRPLIQALVEENNRLLVRVQQRARQNHLLLTRSLEIMQRFLSSLFAAGQTPIYGGDGAVLPAAAVGHSLCRTVI